MGSSSKPIVLHLGDAIKYNHEFYQDNFQSRFNVIQATETDRESFIQALKSNKYEAPVLKWTRPNQSQIRDILSPIPPTFPNRRFHGPMG